jgi:ABC-2 type transport system ATP-binding protein
MEAIKTINLTKKYKDIIAVNNLNLTINKGELFALLGVNGAGKSTTIKMLSTLTKPTSGEAIVGGFSVVSKPTQVKSIISVSPQETAIAANLTVKENLELICGIYDFDKEKKETKIKELSNKFNLSNMLNKKVSKLSGGYKRRLSIAMRKSQGATGCISFRGRALNASKILAISASKASVGIGSPFSLFCAQAASTSASLV